MAVVQKGFYLHKGSIGRRIQGILKKYHHLTPEYPEIAWFSQPPVNAYKVACIAVSSHFNDIPIITFQPFLVVA
jgi:hypothetical protein